MAWCIVRFQGLQWLVVMCVSYVLRICSTKNPYLSHLMSLGMLKCILWIIHRCFFCLGCANTISLLAMLWNISWWGIILNAKHIAFIIPSLKILAMIEMFNSWMICCIRCFYVHKILIHAQKTSMISYYLCSQRGTMQPHIEHNKAHFKVGNYYVKV